MSRHCMRTVVLTLLALGLTRSTLYAQDLNDLYEQATRAAAKKVAPSVVQIQTQGGTDLVVTTPKGPVFRKALGPTTGVIVSADGYIISSAYNFINNPTTILIVVPGHKEPYLAKRVANDRSRMLSLLKIDAKDLPLPAVVPTSEQRVGQLAIAVGRAFDTAKETTPAVSVGIISALGRVWGKALQTDAKISPVNYGGPLIDVQGRVQGILIPASPRGEGETAGFEWYDSGIGFAVPMDDVMAVVPKLKLGQDLHKGLLGVRFATQDMISGTPNVADVLAKSAAAKAGLQKGDTITEVDGKKVVSMGQLMHQLGPKYVGDKIALKYTRAGKETTVANVELSGTESTYGHPYLGVLPMRDDPKLGVEIRHVFAKSPAAGAGLKDGDRIVKFGTDEKMQGFTGKKHGREELQDYLNTLAAGDSIKLEVTRKEGNKTDTVTVKLEPLPGSTAASNDVPPEKLPETATRKKALQAPDKPGADPTPAAKVDEKKPETGMVKHTTASGAHKYWVYVHDDYDPNVAQAVVLWLHPPGKDSDEDNETLTTAWSAACAERNILIVGLKSDNASGWVPSDAEFLQEILRDVQARYTVDKNRVIAHGLGVGGQMAIYLGFNARDLVRGVAVTGAVITQVKENVPTRRLGFFMVAGDRDPLVKNIAESRTKLNEKLVPVIYRELAGRGREYLDEATLDELVRWIDILDRL